MLAAKKHYSNTVAISSAAQAAFSEYMGIASVLYKITK